MLTELGVIAMLILGTLLWFRKMTKILEMLERMLDDHRDDGPADQFHSRPTTRANAHQ